MLSAIFENERGETFGFGTKHQNAFSADVGGGASSKLGKSQSFSSVGEVVDSQTVNGRTIKMKGVLFGNDISTRKKQMQKIITPLSRGRLVINDEFYASVYVIDAPSFSTEHNDGRYTMRLYSSRPFFLSVEEQEFSLASVEALFSFPVTFSDETPHVFGVTTGAGNVNARNDGATAVPYRFVGIVQDPVNKVRVSNLTTGEFLEIVGEMTPGDRIEVFRGDDGILRATKTNEERTEDILSWISEESTFFELGVGDNIISAGGETSVSSFFYFSPAVWGVVE